MEIIAIMLVVSIIIASILKIQIKGIQKMQTNNSHNSKKKKKKSLLRARDFKINKY